MHDRFLPTGLAHLTDHTLSPPLRAASRAYNEALENLTRTTGLAAKHQQPRPNTSNLTHNA